MIKINVTPAQLPLHDMDIAQAAAKKTFADGLETQRNIGHPEMVLRRNPVRVVQIEFGEQGCCLFSHGCKSDFSNG